jgi:dTDP-4-dehydrorhamnose reductase
LSVKRALVIGSNGLLGQKLSELLVRGLGYAVTLTSVEDKPVREFPPARYITLDITSPKEVKNVVAAVEPDVIINCAAMTDVDACEVEREIAWKINVEGVEHLIDAARRTGARLFHVSSDYVFDGKSGPYDEDARPEPLSYYGKSKLASENALRSSGVEYFIARTMVLYGYASGVKQNFALWLVQKLEKGETVRIVDDQLGNPTLADDLAHGILSGVELGRNGIYNIAGRDIVSRYEFALTLARVFGFEQRQIVPISTDSLKQQAARPMKSGLITLKAEVELGFRPSTVEEGLLVLKRQLSRSTRRLPDSGPVPRSPGTRTAKR